MTPAIAERSPSIGRALPRFEKPGEESGRASGPGERPHHENPSVERARTTLATRKKAQQRERMSD